LLFAALTNVHKCWLICEICRHHQVATVESVSSVHFIELIDVVSAELQQFVSFSAALL